MLCNGQKCEWLFNIHFRFVIVLLIMISKKYYNIHVLQQSQWVACSDMKHMKGLGPKRI